MHRALTDHVARAANETREGVPELIRFLERDRAVVRGGAGLAVR